MSTKAQPSRDVEPAIEFEPPLKPHKKLFIVLLAAFVVWVGVLLGLYFKTVYPARHGGGATQTAR